MERWTVVTSNSAGKSCVLAVLPALIDAIEYATFVFDFDNLRFPDWITYVVEGDFLNTHKS